MLYSLDSSALIDAWRKWYSPNHHPTLWERVENLADSGSLKLVDVVLQELKEQDDELYSWCKDKESKLIVPSDSSIQSRVSFISNKHNLNRYGSPKKNFADPFVIALAMSKGGIVVTHEKATGNLNGPRIPDVCKHENLPSIEFYRLIEKEGWMF
jgi:hypothetical protein